MSAQNKNCLCSHPKRAHTKSRDYPKEKGECAIYKCGCMMYTYWKDWRDSMDEQEFICAVVNRD